MAIEAFRLLVSFVCVLFNMQLKHKKRNVLWLMLHIADDHSQ